MVKYQKTQAELDFELIKTNLFNFWKNIAINIFEWKGLEDISPTLTSEIIETYLFDNGKCGFYNDSNLGYIALKLLRNGGVNIYGKPTAYTLNGYGYTKNVKADDIVVIKNNALMTPTADAINMYVSILADIELTKMLQRNKHKTPIMLECTEETELTARNIFKKIRANEPVIFKHKGRGEVDIGINILNDNTNYINDKLEDDYNCYVAKILTYLGLDNFVEDKAERVQSAEVQANQEFIISSFRTMLEARQKACEEINTKFGLKLSVDYVKAEQIETDEQPNEEGENE